MAVLGRDHFDRWLAVEQRLKGVDVEQTPNLEASLRSALSTVYQAVAADIDGTLTSPRLTIPARDVTDGIRGLLVRGVRIILVTGRGHSAEAVLKRILESLGEEPFSSRYLSRIHGLVDNGATILEYTRGSTANFSPRPVVELREPEILLNEVLRCFPTSSTSSLLRARARPGRIRLEFSSKESRDSARSSIPEALLASQGFESISIASGIYRDDIFTIDLTPTSKGRALRQLCMELGIDEARCLRLGDQGSEDGNDYDMLESANAFSVDKFSASPHGSHVVVDEKGVVLKNTDATAYLLRQLNFSAPLASPPLDMDALRNSLALFERDVRREAKRHMDRTVDQFAESIARLFSPEPEITVQTGFAYRCYDRFSGAVRVDSWELVSPAATEPLGNLFALDQFDFSSRPPRSDWAMYTDSAMLLRGAHYYHEWTHEWEKREVPFDDILSTHQRFVGSALTGVAVQAELSPSVLRLKLLLGVMDIVRDILLKHMHFAFSLYSEVDSGPDIALIDDISSLLSRHTEFMVAFHLSGELDWQGAHETYFGILSDVHASIVRLRTVLKDHDIIVFDATTTGPRLFRSRECDWFLENVAACQIALDKRVQQHTRLREGPFAVAGLVYGGLELPFICQALGRRMGLEIIPGLVSASSYTRKAIQSDPSRSGLLEAGLNEWVADRARLNGEIRRPSVLVADDNMTTARSLQKAWDVLQTLGFEVLGAVIVRYPGLNRFVQMAEIDKSVPDPELFMSFVRGLVSPAPYARRVSPSPSGGNPYLDFTNIFNKMDERLKRYLKKSLDRDLELRS